MDMDIERGRGREGERERERACCIYGLYIGICRVDMEAIYVDV